MAAAETGGSREGRAWLCAVVVLTAGTIVTVTALAPPAATAPGRALAWLLFTGSSMHVAATGWLYTLRDVRRHAAAHRARYLWLPAGLVAASAAAAAATPPALFRWLLLPYFGWQFFHFQKQNLGMAALAARTCRVPPLRAGERRALLLAGWAGIIGLLTRPHLLGLPLYAGASAVPAAIAAGFAAAVVAGLAALSRRPPAGRAGGFAAMYLVALLFPAPIFLFTSPYAAVGGMTAAHGLQYLLLVGLIAGGRPGTPARLARLALLANIALAGGAVLAAFSHLHGGGPGVRLLFGAYLGAVMAHFVIDAGLWRMRDPFPRRLLGSHLPFLGLSPAAPAAAAGRATGTAVITAADRSLTGIG